MASSNGGFRNTNRRASKHAALVKAFNRKRNQEVTTKKRGTSNG
jgi:hypothetical protein